MKNPFTDLRLVSGPTLDRSWRLEMRVKIGTWPFRWQTWQLLPFKFSSESEAQNALDVIRYFFKGSY